MELLTVSLLLRSQINHCLIYRIRHAVKFELAVLIVCTGWIQPVAPIHSTELRGFTFKKKFFTVIA